MDSFNPWDSQGPSFDISNNFVEPSAEISPEIACQLFKKSTNIPSSAKLDRDDIVQYNNFQDFNIHHSYRTSNMEANYLRHMSRERSRKRRRSALSISSEIESGSSASPLLPGNTRSRSQTSSKNGDNESMRSSDLRRTISTNVLNLEQRRQVIELENLEIELQQKKANLKKQEEDIRLQQLQNEKLELDLMERRMRIQEHDSTGL